ncbi:hypothetical protein BDB00DRAFT_851079 [Zychaea mexicana]|uniref:uncharacterized protein n=1 Tax=Zychaea mexicana TaxID=64656 RepID=UPI0022FE54A6|nr:uncharacterized protein BDB00DRAFT_851079 [Zychaea mexicana]KAI9487928.1 hypothetical protein BDB00DRAFT_851079 [Zychaea mexicana]
MLKDFKRRVSRCYTPSPSTLDTKKRDSTMNDKKPPRMNSTNGNNSTNNSNMSSKRKEKRPLQPSPTMASSMTTAMAPSPSSPRLPNMTGAGARVIMQGANRSNTSSLSTLSLSTPSTPTSLASPSPTPNRLQSSCSLMTIGSDQLLDHSHLKPGVNAELLSYNKTINMYRENAKKTNNLDIQCDFAMFLVEAAKRIEVPEDEFDDNEEDNDDENEDNPGNNSNHRRDSNNSSNDSNDHVDEDEDNDTDDNNNNDDVRSFTPSTAFTSISAAERANQYRMRQSYLLEAEKLLKQVSLRGHSESQFYLGNMYAAGILHRSGKPEFDKAFPLFVQAAKHHNPDAAFRTAKCYEDGLGTKRDRTKASQYYKKAASLNHPGAMYRFGLAEMNGELGVTRNVRDGHKWLKRSAEAATPQYPHALHELALLHEKGFDSVIFADPEYAVHLYTEAASLGYAPSAFRLGECYEFGRLQCKIDPTLSIQYYSIAANQDHPEACFALTAWYLMGTDTLESSEDQAFAWAYRAASMGFPKAEYAIGYFHEVGIAVPKDMQEAIRWYITAADKGEKRAAARLHQLPSRYRSSIRRSTSAVVSVPPPPPSIPHSPSRFVQHRESFISRAKGLLGSKKGGEEPIANFV